MLFVEGLKSPCTSSVTVFFAIESVVKRLSVRERREHYEYLKD